MELVYLWVEEYKNIYKQGFNFSPRFECDYDDKTKKLSIEKNDNFIENFFGDNINITAIVGKNGSGKSSIAEMILPKIPHKKHKKYIIVAFDFEKNEFKSYGNIQVDISTSDTELSFSVVEIGANKNRDYNHNITYLNGTTFDFRTFEKYQYSDSDDNIFIPKYINQYKKNLKLFENKTFFYKFDTIRFLLKVFNRDEIVKDIKMFSKNLSNFNLQDIEENILFMNTGDILCLNLKIALIRFYLIQENVEFEQDNLYKILSINNCSEIDRNNFSFISKIDDFIMGLSILKTHEFKEETDILNKKKYYYELNIKDENLSKLSIFQNFFDIPNSLGTKRENLPIFDLELYDSKKDMIYNLLSNGEKQYIRLLIETISNRSSGDLSISIEPKLYVFDEIESSLHPEWQKKIFYDIYSIFKIWKKQVHLIFLTHSPFLLSDIPKQNIIFLDTYKKEDVKVKNGNQNIGNCKVLQHDEVLAKKETFGANIHTLLSDSFFMEDGLMGEFAKNKIQEIMNYLNNDKKLEDISTPQNQIKKVIESIGEDLLRRKLSDMYYEKFEKDELEREKQQLKEQQDEIIKRLESIEKRQNDTD